MDSILIAHDLSRSYGSFQALAPTELTLVPGERVALTGTNGAGKTTLLLCLSGLLRPSSGEVTIEGYDLYRQEREAKSRLAFVPDVPRFYQELTAWEHLRFIAMAYNAIQGFEQRAERLLREFDLWEARDQYPYHYSRGMSLKLGILLALIRPFKVLLLDEPTSALDPDSAGLLENKLRELSQMETAILFSTHNLDLAERLGSRILKMEHAQFEEA